MLIKGVAKDTDVAVITILNVPDEPGMSFKIFGLLAQKNITVDIILQSTGRGQAFVGLRSIFNDHALSRKARMMEEYSYEQVWLQCLWLCA